MLSSAEVLKRDEECAVIAELRSIKIIFIKKYVKRLEKNLRIVYNINVLVGSL